MQINLLPKSKEKEREQKKVNYLIFTICFIIWGALAVTILFLVSIKIANYTITKGLEKDTKEVREEIKNYSELEENINTLVSNLTNVRLIIDNKLNWQNFYAEFEKLMPRDAFISEISGKDNIVTFKTKTISVEKVSEFIESLRKHEITIKKDEDITKVKLFGDIEITNYAKISENNKTYYAFDFKANLAEEIWEIK